MSKAEVRKGAIGYEAAHSGGTRKASPETAWNGPAEVARAGNDPAQLRRMHAWVDSQGNPEAKSSYKLPHHRADGTVVLRGVRAAIGAIRGARGGVEIPAGDQRGVYNHLARHVRDFGLEPPDFVQRSYGVESEFSAQLEIKKIDDELGHVFGWASISEEEGALVVDREGDVIEPVELEKGAYAFVKNARVASVTHRPETIGAGVLIESMVFTKEKQEILGVDLPVGWWVGFQVEDEQVRKRLREGREAGGRGLSMLSIGGSGTMSEV